MPYTPSMTKNTNARLSVAHRVIALFLILVANWCATFYMAWKLGYPLSAHQPFAWLIWMMDADVSNTLPHGVIAPVVGIVLFGTMAAVLTGWFLGYRRSLVTQETPGLHGTAHFASAEEIRRTGLLGSDDKGPSGVVVGAVEIDGEIHLLRHNGPEHITVEAPTRSGKGTTCAVPTALTWPHSLFVNDIKVEILNLTGGFRHQAGQLVMCFEPTSVPEAIPLVGDLSFNSVRWNPIQEIRVGTPYDVKDAQNLAAMIADPDAKGMDDHWVASSYELLTGLLLHIAYNGGDAQNLPAVSRFLGDPRFSDVRQLLRAVRDFEHDSSWRYSWRTADGQPTATHPTVVEMAVKMLNKEDKELSGVISTASTKLSLYADPIVAANVARSDFRIDDLMDHERPVAFYFAIRPSDKKRLRPLVRLFIEFLLARRCEKMAFVDGRGVREYRHRLLAMLDELPTLKKLDILQDALGYMAGFGIKGLLIYQDMPQLLDAYGENESIRSGCHIHIRFAPNTQKSAEEISRMCGVTTAPRQTVSYSGRRGGPTLSDMSVSEELVERPLLTDDEVRALPPDDTLVFVSGHPVIRGRKAHYFRNPELLRRASIQLPAKFTATPVSDLHAFSIPMWMMVGFEWRGDEGLLSLRVYELFPICTVTARVIGDDGSVTDVEGELAGPDARGRERHPNIRHWEPDHDEVIVRFGQRVSRQKSIVIVLRAIDESIAVSGALCVRGDDERDAYALGRRLTAPDAMIEAISDGVRLKGRALGETPHFVILGDDQEGAERFSVHRKAALSRPLVHNEKVAVLYTAGKGAVT